MIRVLIVDDNAIFRQGMQHLFASVPDFEVSAVAATAPSGVDAALARQVDVVLMDLTMPGGISGIEATRKLAAAAPHIGIVVMTMLEDDDMVFQALRAGARGYLVKGAAQREILDAVRGVHAGQAIIGADVARRLGSLVGSPTPEDPFPDLTGARARDAQPARRRRHAVRSPIGSASRARPRNHLSSIFTKLEAVDRTEAVLKARAAGLPR